MDGASSTKCVAECAGGHELQDWTANFSAQESQGKTFTCVHARATHVHSSARACAHNNEQIAQSRTHEHAYTFIATCCSNNTPRPMTPINQANLVRLLADVVDIHVWFIYVLHLMTSRSLYLHHLCHLIPPATVSLPFALP